MINSWKNMMVELKISIWKVSDWASIQTNWVVLESFNLFKPQIPLLLNFGVVLYNFQVPLQV